MSKEKSYWLKSGLFTLLERGSMVLFGLGSFKILTYLLGVNGIGTWAGFLAVITVLEIGRAGLIQNGLIRYLSTCETADYEEIASASLVLNILLTIVTILFLLLIAPLLSTWLKTPAVLYYIYCMTSVCLIPFQQFNFTQQANFDFKGVFWASFTRKGLFFVLILLFFLFGQGLSLTHLALFQVFTATCASLCSYFFARKYIRFSNNVNWKWVKELFHYGKFTFGTNISAMLHKNIDKWMLITFLGATPAGLYETCIRVTNIVEVPTFSIASIVFPKSALSSKDNDSSKIKALYERAVGAIMAFTIPCIIFVLLFPSFIIRFISNEAFLDATTLLCITILYGLFFPFANQFGTTLDSIGKPKINFIFVVLAVILNIIFNYIFIMQFGLLGAAYGTLLAYCITFILNQLVLYKMFGIQFWKAFIHIPFFYNEAFLIIKSKLGSTKPISTNSQKNEPVT